MIRVDGLKIKGAEIGPESALPILRDVGEHRSFEQEGLPESLSNTLGSYCGYRVLPYKLQNHYTRNQKDMALKTVVLENNVLKATFLPEYGGRLYSLYNKKLKRELLSVNPVFQPANLGLRNAWFSGGIEWNMAHFGHSYLTCDHVHFGLCKEGDYEFVRLFEYERVKGLFYQIDFHLPEDSEHLLTYTKIFNEKATSSPLYYWSNTAVSEMNQARVFSSTKEVVYIKPYFNEKGEMVNTFSYGQVPYLEGIEGDVSYPRNFNRSNEYFYQIDEKTTYPFEAVGYNDGFLFYECSTQPLRYRKMFCWGTHKGGTKWQAYLSEKHTEKYVEIQAGLYPTQLHSEHLAARSSVEFMQVFGGGYVDQATALYKEHDASTAYVQAYVDQKLSKTSLLGYEKQLKSSSQTPVASILHQGLGYGRVEIEKLQQSGLTFTVDSMTFDDHYEDESRLLVALLKGDALDVQMHKDAVTYVIDPSWRAYLKAYDHEYTSLLLSLTYSEHGDLKTGIQILEDHLKEDATSIYVRTLANMYQKTGHHARAKEYYDLAYLRMDGMQLPYYQEDFLVEYMRFLNETKAYETADMIYHRHKDLEHEEFLVECCKTHYALGHLEKVRATMDITLERIREGDTTLVEIWYKLKALDEKLAIDIVKERYDAPESIDFRML